MVNELCAVAEELGGEPVLGRSLRTETDLQTAIREGFPQKVLDEVTQAAGITLAELAAVLDLSPRSLQRRRRDSIRRWDTDALEREVDREHAAQRLRFVERDLRRREGMITGLQDDAVGRLDRFVARVARYLDISDGQGLPRRRVLRPGGRGGEPERHQPGCRVPPAASPSHRPPRPTESARPRSR